MLKQVTFTGVDDCTDIDALVALQKEFPFAEFGVLISASSSGTGMNNRYPDLSILNRLRDKGLHLSCHVCGAIARDIIQKNDWNELHRMLDENESVFDRFQLNVSNVKEFSKDVNFPSESKFIIQINDNSYPLFAAYRNLDNVFGFYDNSGGKGVFSDKWMCVGSVNYFGYAGGISEENVTAVIQDIIKVNYNDYWIDMESSVRTNDWFDVEKCRRVLEIVKPIIKEQEALHRAQMIVFASMTRPDIEEACRMRGIKVVKNRHDMEVKLVNAIKNEILGQAEIKPTPTTF